MKENIKQNISFDLRKVCRLARHKVRVVASLPRPKWVWLSSQAALRTRQASGNYGQRLGSGRAAAGQLIERASEWEKPTPPSHAKSF